MFKILTLDMMKSTFKKCILVAFMAVAGLKMPAETPMSTNTGVPAEARTAAEAKTPTDTKTPADTRTTTDTRTSDKTAAEVRVASVFGNGMVLQREKPIRVWGWAESGGEFDIQWKGGCYHVTADGNGRWEVVLPAEKAGGPYSMNVGGRELNDILIGDVFLCSGQSNMELPVRRVMDMFAAEVYEYENTEIRLIAIPQEFNFSAPQEDLSPCSWKPCTQENVMSFSALAYFFAKELNERTGVPVGIVNASWGGTPVEAWMSEESLKDFPEHLNIKRIYEDDGYRQRIKELEGEDFRRWNTTLDSSDPGLTGPIKWYAAELDDSSWKTVDMLSQDWGNDGLRPQGGSHWLRKDFEVNGKMTGKEAVLRLGCIVDADSAYVNGHFVGNTTYQYPPRIYRIPAGVLKKGRNNVTVRVISNGGQPSFVPEKPYKVVGAKGEVSLEGEWKYKQGSRMPAAPSMMFFYYKPVCLYNAMISPLRGLNFKGVLWYQGESNVDRWNEYSTLLSLMMADWREKFEDPDLPFYIVELADFLHPDDKEGRAAWAEMRKQQAKAADMTVGAVLIPNQDLGEWNDIHPLNKKTLGKRIADAVLANNDGHGLWLPEEGPCAVAAGPCVAAEVVVDPALDLVNDGFMIKDLPEGRRILAKTEIGAMYGRYALQRLERTGRADGPLDIREEPSYERRILNHWDNLNNTIERGYAGWSIWHWGEPVPVDLIRSYARANASIGINGSVLNNVNATPEILNEDNLKRVAEIADVMRPYGIHTYLSVNFSSPAALGGLPTSDPLDPQVRKWWADKAAEIYALIPDFGGFLVKANSEGLPGPQDFGRTHADGANMLAEALEPYGGIVMWRAFVYAPDSPDRANQAYEEFMPLDGQFKDNVIVQIKNGPVDFQPREPFSPLFGGMSKTAMMVEFQITQEYLGFSNHLVYLSPLFEECLDSDTYCQGPGSTVAAVTTGKVYPEAYNTTAIAGVANIGRDVNWCGHHFAQSSWYAFGRLAWDADLSSEEIGREWLVQTFTDAPEFVEPVLDMMMPSREAAVDYMMPLGLHHLFAGTHHYGPEPWYAPEGSRPDWLPKYYHQAGPEGIGFDRTRTGSGNVDQYHEPLASMYNSLETCPEELLLWFHHIPWDHKMSSGRTFWDEMCFRYERGINKTREYMALWDKMKPYVDSERWEHVRQKLVIQESDARWWRDACIQYFQEFSGLPVSAEFEQPERPLEELKAIKLNMLHHN